MTPPLTVLYIIDNLYSIHLEPFMLTELNSFPYVIFNFLSSYRLWYINKNVVQWHVCDVTDYLGD